MKIPHFNLIAGDISKPQRGSMVLLVPEERALLKVTERELLKIFADTIPLFNTQAFSGKDSEILLLTPPAFHGRPLILVGVGKAKELTLERLRRVAALAAKQASRLKQDELIIAIPPFVLEPASAPTLDNPREEQLAVALLEGASLGLYSYDKYKTLNHDVPLVTVTLQAPDESAAGRMRPALLRAKIIVEGVWLARDLANAPGNEVFPESFASVAKAEGKKGGFSVSIFNEKKIKSLKMGGLLGVSRGSAKPPRFIVLRYGHPKAPSGTVVLIGKGVTFDSGGISIKPSANMAEMKMDMAGAAAVLGAFKTTAGLKLPVHLVGLIPMTENLPGGNALKPGDILRHFNGKTSEIDNTDAEGRLILADALAYASQFKAHAVIDIATLTGAVVVALGHYASGLLGNNAALIHALREAGERTGERVWELPMFEEYAGLVKSDIADVKNVGGRWAGAITGAMFLKQFIGDYPWAHLDIAGTAIMEEAMGYIPKGGSGVGVRLLTDYLQHLPTLRSHP